jgi:hypothetical protein
MLTKKSQIASLGMPSRASRHEPPHPSVLSADSITPLSSLVQMLMLLECLSLKKDNS